MDISSVGNLDSLVNRTQTNDAVSTLVLKKAIDLQAQSALSLLQALPLLPSNPSHLGSSVDIKA